MGQFPLPVPTEIRNKEPLYATAGRPPGLLQYASKHHVGHDPPSPGPGLQYADTRTSHQRLPAIVARSRDLVLGQGSVFITL